MRVLFTEMKKRNVFGSEFDVRKRTADLLLGAGTCSFG